MSPRKLVIIPSLTTAVSSLIQNKEYLRQHTILEPDVGDIKSVLYNTNTSQLSIVWRWAKYVLFA